jgi:hypothetical protein
MLVKRGYALAGALASRRAARAAAFALAALLGCVENAAQAQGRGDGPGIEIPAEIIVAPAVVTHLPIRITRAEAASQAMLMVRGLPPRVTLSEGRSFSSGVWAVPMANVGKIELAPAHGTSGKADLSIQLVTLDGRVLAEARSSLYIIPPELTQQKAPPGRGDATVMTVAPLAGRPPRPAEPPLQAPASLGGAPGLTAAELDNARRLVQRGDTQMEEGKIAAARLFYRSAAENGYAPAALALGATYDARQLTRWRVLGGVQAEPDEARKWYEKARELGSAEAERRLQDLASR